MCLHRSSPPARIEMRDVVAPGNWPVTLKEILMQRTVFFSITLLALVACETATEPPVPDADLRRSVQSTGSGSYAATVLPDGIVGEQAMVVIDDNGGVFASVVHSQTMRAARWTVDAGGAVAGPILLGTLQAPFDRADQYIHSVSRDGRVVLGYARKDHSPAGWVWANGSMRLLLPVLSQGRVHPFAVNDGGVIVGQIGTTVDGVSGDWGAVWLPPYDAEPILLPRMEGYTLNSARGITNNGVVSGWVRGSGMIDVLVQWQIDPEGNVLSGPVRLEGIDQILMRAVNQDLDVIGSFHGNGIWEPYLFRSATGQHIDLGSLQGYTSGSAGGVNNRSPDGSVQAVGSYWTQRILDGRAVLWTVDAAGATAGPTELGLPPAMIVKERPRQTAEFISGSASSINSHGWIVGWSRREDRTYFATLWRPGQNGGDGGGGDCNPHPKTGKCR
jgi:hypothetical protein